MGRFRYGACEWSVKARGAALCQLAADEKLDCVQLGVGEEIFCGKGLADPAVAEEYLEASEKCGVEIDSLCPQFVDQYSFTMAKSGEEEQIAAALCERAIDLCQVFGCKSYLLPVLEKNGIEDGAPFHRAVEAIKRFGDKAAGRGILTCLELNRSVDQVRDLLDAVDNPMVKLFFDSQNLYALDGTSMARYFTALADVIAGVHLKDGVGTMLSGSLLGEGTSGFYRTAGAILDNGYGGSLIIESVYDKPTVCKLGSERELLARDAATLRRVFEK
ncbi:MAG: sugar phosphate isomerase/epimerase [Lachnospiraceae bacterium]|nr:sugar phosphate isomerase/epimerase [Lachnospiraceae bacterium]